MKSLGDTLRSAREKRRISIDRVARETNISRNYLEALENETFGEFPAEAYLIGFLRNYADFLGLDSDRAVGQFKNYKLNEEPTPIDELVGPPKGTVARKVFLWAGSALIAAAAGIFGVPPLITAMRDFRGQRAVRAAEEVEAPAAREILPAVPLWEGEVRPGDTVRLEGPGGEAVIALSDGDGRLELDGGTNGRWSMLLGEEIYIPSDNGSPAWRLYLKDIGLPGGGAVVEIQQLPVLSPEEGIAESEVEIEPPTGDSERRRESEEGIAESEVEIEPPPTGDSERRRESRVILTAAQPGEFTLDIAFRNFSLFRYQVDGRDPLEAYYRDGDDFRLDVSRSVTIWASNAGALYAKIGGEELLFGRRGEVVVRQIRWVFDEERGEYELTLLPL